MQEILLQDGTIICLCEWQKQQGLPEDKLGKYFSVNERKLKGDFIFAAPLILLADRYRELKGKPVIINSAWRSKEKQEELKMSGYRAAAVSPHCYGMAFDVDTVSKQDTLDSVKLVEQAAKQLGFAVRIGYKEYLRIGQTFVHFDVCPMFFAKGKPMYESPHPKQWETQNRW